MIAYFYSLFFFLTATTTTEIYTLSLHDALPISSTEGKLRIRGWPAWVGHPLLQSSSVWEFWDLRDFVVEDRKSTRLNSSHQIISYAVFCLKKKKITPRSRTGLIRAPGVRRRAVT